MLLPPVLRAEQRFVVVEQSAGDEQAPIDGALTGLDFMFYSNAAGKLMLTRSDTIISGSGRIFKSTATSSYSESLEREHAAVRRIEQSCARQEQMPRVGERIIVNDRSFFP